jgi:Tfp pilus assembly protein PilF
MLCDPLDFDRISKAIQDANKMMDLDVGNGHSYFTNEGIDEAQENLMNALSHATSIDKQYLKYSSR